MTAPANTLRFCLNETWIERAQLPPTTTLLRFLRDDVGLVGTKEGCAEGDCGACTVVVVEADWKGRATYRAVNACLVLLPMVQGKQVYTVEGLARLGQPHLVQEALSSRLGSQCGYCTPGIVMSLFEGCYREDMDEPWKVDAQMCGNLCRCTGYRPIREAAKAVAGKRPDDGFTKQLTGFRAQPMTLEYLAGLQRYFTPDSLDALWRLLDAHPNARFVNGGTDLSLEVTKRFAEPPLLLSLEALEPLRGLRMTPSHCVIGANVTLTDLEDFSRSSLTPVERMLRYFGSRQIKNRATVGGNLCNASPIGDLAPIFIALNATAVLLSREGERRLPLHAFFESYRKTALRLKEILGSVEIPLPSPTARVAAYKVSKRRELDISAVAAGFSVEVQDDVVASATLAFGGMAATPARAKRAEGALIGKPWTAQSVEAAAALLSQDFTPLSDHRGSARYRLLVAQNLLRGFYEETLTANSQRLPEGHTATVQTQ